MSTPGDNGSWDPQGGHYDAYGNPQGPASAQPPQDPWAQPPASGQDPYAQPSASSSADPYGQQPFSGQDPYAQQPAPGQDPYQQPSAGSASDPYGQRQHTWSPAPGSGPSASDPYGQGATGGAAPQGEPQSRLVVGLLGIFLGGLGVHRFLMGYTTIGLIQIAVSVLTCGVGAWWGIIEGIMVLAKSPAFERDAHGRPLTD